MRPLLHPAPEEMTVEGVLYALSDPVRVQIFMQLIASDCSLNCSMFANVRPVPLPKSSLSQHFKVLREAGLIYSERKGVELQNRARHEEYGRKFGPMICAILEAYSREFKLSGKTSRAMRVRRSAAA